MWTYNRTAVAIINFIFYFFVTLREALKTIVVTCQPKYDYDFQVFKDLEA